MHASKARIIIVVMQNSLNLQIKFLFHSANIKQKMMYYELNITIRYYIYCSVDDSDTSPDDSGSAESAVGMGRSVQ